MNISNFRSLSQSASVLVLTWATPIRDKENRKNSLNRTYVGFLEYHAATSLDEPCRSVLLPVLSRTFLWVGLRFPLQPDNCFCSLCFLILPGNVWFLNMFFTNAFTQGKWDLWTFTLCSHLTTNTCWWPCREALCTAWWNMPTFQETLPPTGSSKYPVSRLEENI